MIMKQNPKENLLKEIGSLKIELDILQEYVLSDCCKQCSDIRSKISYYENKIQQLEQALTIVVRDLV